MGVGLPHPSSLIPRRRRCRYSAKILLRRMISAYLARSFLRMAANSSGVSKTGIKVRAPSLSRSTSEFIAFKIVPLSLWTIAGGVPAGAATLNAG